MPLTHTAEKQLCFQLPGKVTFKLPKFFWTEVLTLMVMFVARTMMMTLTTTRGKKTTMMTMVATVIMILTHIAHPAIQ